MRSFTIARVDLCVFVWPYAWVSWRGLPLWVGTIRYGSFRGCWSSARPRICYPPINTKRFASRKTTNSLGSGFRQPEGGAPGLEVNLFIDKHDGFDQDALPLTSRIVP